MKDRNQALAFALDEIVKGSAPGVVLNQDAHKLLLRLWEHQLVKHLLVEADVGDLGGAGKVEAFVLDREDGYLVGAQHQELVRQLAVVAESAFNLGDRNGRIRVDPVEGGSIDLWVSAVPGIHTHIYISGLYYHNARIDGGPTATETDSDTLVCLVVLPLQSGKLLSVLHRLLLDGRLVRMKLERERIQLVDVLHRAVSRHVESRLPGSKHLAVVGNVISVDSQGWAEPSILVLCRCDAVDAACGSADEQLAGPVRLPQDFVRGYFPVDLFSHDPGT